MADWEQGFKKALDDFETVNASHPVCQKDFEKLLGENKK